MRLHDILKEAPFSPEQESRFLKDLKKQWATRRERDEYHYEDLVQGHEPKANLVGSGSYASVFAKKGVPTVVKVTRGTDICAMQYLKWAKRNQDNPHVPKIFSLETSRRGDVYVRMERLNELDVSKFKWSKKHLPFLYYWFQDEKDKQNAEWPPSDLDFITLHAWRKAYGNLKYMTFPKQVMDKVKADSLVQTIVSINKLKRNGCDIDLGLGHNMMVRPGTDTIVITDPLA